MKIAAAALGLTTICLVWIGEPLVEPLHYAIYHWDGHLSNLFGSVVLDVLVGWIVWLLLLLAARRPGKKRVAIWSAVVFFLPLIVLKSLSLLLIVRPQHVLTLVAAGAGAAGYLVTMLLWRPAFITVSERVIDFTMTLLAFAAITGILLLGQLGWFAWEARALNDPLPLHHPQTTAGAEAKPRIIWIILDELSYRQLYEHRFPGLQMPAFDALAAQATVFSHIIPAGLPTEEDVRTEKIVPSLLTGKRIDAVRFSGAGQLSIHNYDSNAWQRFDPQDTVFQDALNAGYGTSVAGWYNPYCRIMPAVLDHCFWEYDEDISNGMIRDGTIAFNMWHPAEFLFGTPTLQHVLSPLWRIPERNQIYTVGHILDYHKLSEEADKVLGDPSAGFTLVHFPLPHPAGIYNRAAGQLTTGASSYIDNLALTDKYLAHVRSMMEQSGQWDSSTIVIMGDHGWRTMLWKDPLTWTAEEESASDGGRFDDRPAYIVKLAGQQKHVAIDTPFHAVETRKLMDALMVGKIRSEEDLSAWVRQTH